MKDGSFNEGQLYRLIYIVANRENRFHDCKFLMDTGCIMLSLTI